MDSLVNNIRRIQINDAEEADEPAPVERPVINPNPQPGFYVIHYPGPVRPGTLEAVIEEPPLNTNVLKAIYQIIFGEKATAERCHRFLANWHEVYPDHIETLQGTVSYAYQRMMLTTRLHEYLQSAHYNYDVARQRFLDQICELHNEYRKTNYLHNGHLEKLLTLVFVNAYAPPFFFALFDYTCSPGFHVWKAWLLERFYPLELVGYNEQRDQRLLQMK